MEWLEIPPAEEGELTTRISQGEKYRRNSARRRERRDQIIVAGPQSGLTHNQIIADVQRLMGERVSIKTVQRTLRKAGLLGRTKKMTLGIIAGVACCA